MVAVKEDGTGIAGSYEVANNTPANHAGAVWGTSGPVLDGAGNVYATTGNSFSPPPTGNDQSDGALKLSAGAGLLDFFQPPSWPADNAVDLDLGSTWPVFVGTDVFVLGKQRTAFLLAPSSLGGTDHQMPVGIAPQCLLGVRRERCDRILDLRCLHDRRPPTRVVRVDVIIGEPELLLAMREPSAHGGRGLQLTGARG